MSELPIDATQGNVLDRLVKHRIPESIEGSPTYFKKSKRDLDTMVRELGLPSLFIAITMNESGDHRGFEYTMIDEAMKSWNAASDWQDAPIECNRAFIARLDHVLHNFTLVGPRVLGHVKDYAIRFECQRRGSLHVHMCIWLDETDVSSLDERIIACVPTAYNTTTGEFIEPPDLLLKRLYIHAILKQQHQCCPKRSRAV